MARRGRKRQLDAESLYWQLISSGVGTVAACKEVGYRPQDGVPVARQLLGNDLVHADSDALQQLPHRLRHPRSLSSPSPDRNRRVSGRNPGGVCRQASKALVACAVEAGETRA